MDTFAQAPKESQQTSVARSTKPGRALFERGHSVGYNIRKQSAIGNQAVTRFPRTNAEGYEVGRMTTAPICSAHNFSHLPLHSAIRTTLQPKLNVSTPGDAYEQEADRVADAVISGDRPNVSPVSHTLQPKLFRSIMRPTDLVDSTVPPEEVQDGGPLETGASQEVQRSGSGNPGVVTPHFDQSLQHAVHNGGNALPASTRSFMENRIGWDFSSVRVHSDTHADSLAQQINARAFTVGDDIFFARSLYQPETSVGQHLLAHELTHVVQQSEGKIARQIQRQTSCSSYPLYNTGADLTTYNCAGLALRTYQYTSPPSAVYESIAANFLTPQSPQGGTCGAGRVKFWLWQYDLHFEDDQGNVIAQPQPDFHIVGGRVDVLGNDPTDVYSKNGKRPVYGPNTGPSFRPPTRERATSNSPSETPITTAQGQPVIKVRSNMSEAISCAKCYP